MDGQWYDLGGQGAPKGRKSDEHSEYGCGIQDNVFVGSNLQNRVSWSVDNQLSSFHLTWSIIDCPWVGLLASRMTPRPENRWIFVKISSDPFQKVSKGSSVMLSPMIWWPVWYLYRVILLQFCYILLDCFQLVQSLRRFAGISRPILAMLGTFK